MQHYERSPGLEADVKRCFAAAIDQLQENGVRTPSHERRWSVYGDCSLEECRSTVPKERRHDLTTVGRDDALEQRDRTRDFLLAKKTHDAKHRQTAVVHLGNQAVRLLLRGHTLGHLNGS